MTASRRFIGRPVAAAALLRAAACQRYVPPSTVQIAFVPQASPSASYVEVRGIGSAAAASLRRLAPTSEEWARVFTVRVLDAAGAAHATPVAGKYTVEGNGIRFLPLFPLDPGRRYQARYDGTGAGQPSLQGEAIVAPPAAAPMAPVRVTGIFPSGGRMPENQLRFYIHFSGPMGRRGGIEHVTLLDDRGRVVVDPFLPVDGELWNADRIRYTVFFDPGRQKHGILPNRELGPSLEAGRTYTLVVDRNWIDGNGQPLEATWRHSFTVGPADAAPLETASWKVDPPHAGTREPIAVTFPEALDHGLLLRAIGVRRDGIPVVGEVRIELQETRWVMTPVEPWRAGRYELVALGILEDLAGNRIGRAFEVDAAHRPDAEDDSAITSVPFSLLPATR